MKFCIVFRSKLQYFHTELEQSFKVLRKLEDKIDNFAFFHHFKQKCADQLRFRLQINT